MCTRSITDREARLLVISCDGTIRAITVPGAKPALGTVSRTTRIKGVKGKTGVTARIRCKGPQGTVCSGRALLTANGQVIGESAYALPARPGSAAGQLDREILTTVAVPKKVTVKLLARS